MRFTSTSDAAHTVSFSEAVNCGIAPDGGLFLPESIPVLSPGSLRMLRGMSFPEISFRVAQCLLGDDLPEEALHTIIREALTFPAPLQPLDDSTSVLELFHGPTLAFKDFGARFLARTIGYLHKDDPSECTVLVATSGDTGSAVASGFAGVLGVRVVLLYPSGRISATQELQMTTLGGNVSALEIDGTFDDCQRLVKQAFADPEIVSRRRLTSANSINVARLIPQMFYYFHAYTQLPDRERLVTFSVPSGNLGNLTAGLLAWKMGLPVSRFIAGANINDVFPRFLNTGDYVPRQAVATISNAMDVGEPSNLARIIALFGGDLLSMRQMIVAVSVTEEETRAAIRNAYQNFGYILDPHGAVAYSALENVRCQSPDKGVAVTLATAHPAKFLDIYADADLRGGIIIPERLKRLLEGTKRAVPLSARFGDLKEFLLSP